MHTDLVKKVRYTIAIAAGKGGVGKSSVAVNLALCLAKKKYSVGIVDADIYGPSFSRMLPTSEDMRVSRENPEQMLPFSSLGIKAISVSYIRKEGEGLFVRAPIANGFIGELLDNVDWGELDFLLVDFPPGTGDIQLTIMQKMVFSGALIVTTPQEVALMDVRKATEMFHRSHVAVLGVVENMSYFEEPVSKRKYYPLGRGGGKKISKEFGVPFLGEIPLDPHISACGDEGKSLFSCVPDSGAALAYQELSSQVVDHLYELEQAEVRCKKHFDFAWEIKDVN